MILNTYRRLLRGVWLLGILGVLNPVHQLQAQDLTILDDPTREAFQAVGRVNSAGYTHRRGCSGTLIAPDLVVTAAHCVGKLGAAQPRMHFVAGWYRGRFTAHRQSKSIQVHPLYDLTEGPKRFWYDVAVIHLEGPIPNGLVAPIPLAQPDQSVTGKADLYGYANVRPHALSGAANCPMLSQSDRRYIFGCEVLGGTSGGAVIMERDNAPALAAVIVARSGPEGRAVAVPVSDWLWRIWRDAKRRAEQRH